MGERTDVAVHVAPNRYQDSISLMVVSQRLQGLPGVRQAMVCMATPLNRALLASLGLLAEGAAEAGPDDLVVAVGAESPAAAEGALAEAVRWLDGGGGLGPVPGGGAVTAVGGTVARADGAAGVPEGTAVSPGAAAGFPDGEAARGGPHTLQAARGGPRTLASALRHAPGARLAFIAVPGPYGALEARRALLAGLDVMLFSDNVSLEAERSLKEMAAERGLLLMGPDCGTALIDGVGLGFANAVRRGPVGIVAASGTGAQELSVLIDRLGCGVSQIIGTGGRDLTEPVGGRMTLAGLARLGADPGTEVILLVSKDPAPGVADRVAEAAAAARKPVIFCLPGSPGALSLDEAAVEAVHRATGAGREGLWARLGGEVYTPPGHAGLPAPGGGAGAAPGGVLPGPGAGEAGEPPGPGAERCDLRGLFAGGTLCQQARRLLAPLLGPIASDRTSRGHALVDLGDDRFTRGRAHPMIDPTMRRAQLRAEAADRRTGVILLDIVLGHGAHPDPAGAILPEVAEAVRAGIAVVASVTGTEADPQRRSHQEARLREAGALVLPTARLAALAAAAVLRKGGGA